MVITLEHPVHGIAIRKHGMGTVTLYKASETIVFRAFCNQAEGKGRFKAREK